MRKNLQHETIKHIKAYEYYYQLGDIEPHRNCTKVAEKFNTSLYSVHKWRKSFNWDERVIKRDAESAKELAKRNNKDLINTRADYRVEIKDNITIIKSLLIKAAEVIAEGLIKIQSVKDVAIIMETYDMLVRLDLGIMGDKFDDDKPTINITLPPEFIQQNNLIQDNSIQPIEMQKQVTEIPQQQAKTNEQEDKYIVFN